MDPFIERLKSDMEIWISRNLIDRDRARAIISAYETRAIETSGHENSGRLLVIISILGAICLGAGGILFVASNWEQLPRLARVAILLGSTFGTLYGGFKLTENSEYPKTGLALVFTSSILWGASIALVAQIYHIHTAHTSNGLLLWLFGVFPLTYALQSRSLCTLSAAGTIFWMAWRFTESYSGRHILGLFMVLNGAGILLYWLGTLHDGPGFTPHDEAKPAFFTEFGVVYRLFGAIVASFVMIPLTFHEAIREISRGSGRIGETWVVCVVLYFAAIGLGLCRFIFHRRKITEPEFRPAGAGGEALFHSREALAIMAMGFLGIVIMGLPGSGYDSGLITLAMNLAALAMISGLIYAGVRLGSPGLVNVGIFLFASVVLCRYYDMFYTILDRSLFFVGAGAILLFGSVWLERRRRLLISPLKALKGGDACAQPQGKSHE